MPSKKVATFPIPHSSDHSSKNSCRLPLGPDEARNQPARLHEITWRIFRIMAEFVEGFERLARIKPSVSIFGSARTAPTHATYQLAEEIAHELSNAGFSVVSGGGPGIMEAANKGAYLGKSPSIGLNIQLPH